MLNNNSNLKTNTASLQEILNTINNLPEASSNSNSNNYVHVIFNTNQGNAIKWFDKDGNAMTVPNGNSEYDVRGGIISYATGPNISIIFSNTNFSNNQIFQHDGYKYYITCIQKNNTTVTYTYTEDNEL